MKFRPLGRETRFLFLKIRKLILNIHCTCIHVCTIPILHVFVFQHSFPSFCKIVIIQDQTHSTGSAGHFVSFKQLKRKTPGETPALSSRCSSAVGSGTAGYRARWPPVQAALPEQLCSQGLAVPCPTAFGSRCRIAPCWTTKVRLSPHGVLCSLSSPCQASCQLPNSWYYKLSLPCCPCRCF